MSPFVNMPLGSVIQSFQSLQSSCTSNKRSPLHKSLRSRLSSRCDASTRPPMCTQSLSLGEVLAHGTGASNHIQRTSLCNLFSHLCNIMAINARHMRTMRSLISFNVSHTRMTDFAAYLMPVAQCLLNLIQRHSTPSI